MTAEEVSSICGAQKLLPAAFVPGMTMPGITHMALTCVRKPGHPEPDLDASLHACGTSTWVTDTSSADHS